MKQHSLILIIINFSCFYFSSLQTTCDAYYCKPTHPLGISLVPRRRNVNCTTGCHVISNRRIIHDVVIQERQRVKTNNQRINIIRPKYNTELFTSSSSSENYHDNNGVKDSKNKSKSSTVLSILNAALLISGTTIGGGFLALPTVTSPAGFIPSSITIIGVWLYFLSQSFILVECLLRTKSKDIPQPGVAAATKSTFGVIGERMIGILLTILIEATLVSQISRAGLMYPPMYRVTCAVAAISIAAVVFLPQKGVQFASNANSLLTGGFLLSALAVFGFGVKDAVWSRLFLSNDWNVVPNSIPTFLQLLVYGEIVPSVCTLLKYNVGAIRIAIFIGSFLTLCLQLGWSALGISLIPPGSIGGTSNNDAVNILLSQQVQLKVPVICLAITAILTTILGSYLALLTTFNDVINKTNSYVNSESSDTKISTNSDTMKRNSTSTKQSRSISLRQRITIGSLITLPALSIASTSPSVFLNAIDFAGSYPVLLLWGVIPPIIALLQRRKSKNKEESSFDESNKGNISGPSYWLAFLAVVSLGMVGMNIKDDVLSLLRKL